MPASGPITSDEITTAIRAVLNGGASYRLPDGTEVTRADIVKLQSMLDAALASEQTAARRSRLQKLSFGRIRD